MVNYRVVDLRSSFEVKEKFIRDLYDLQIATWGANAAETVSFELFQDMLLYFRFCAVAEESSGQIVCSIFFSKPRKDNRGHAWIRIGFIGRRSLLKVMLGGILRKCFGLVTAFAEQNNAVLWVSFEEKNTKMHRFAQRAGFQVLLDSNEAVLLLEASKFQYDKFEPGPPPSFNDPFSQQRQIIFTRPGLQNIN